MKILSTQQIREVDKFTIENEPIASIDLMERASAKCFEWISKNCHKNTHFALFCGVGNNGGDGLAIARMLHENGFKTSCYIVPFSEKKSDDFCMNESRLRKTNCPVFTIKSTNEIPSFKGNSVIIDAVFGTGLARPIDGFAAEIIKSLNVKNVKIIAIDIPSGLFCEDNSKNSDEAIIKAAYTLSFEVGKLAFMLPENSLYCGDWYILPIGLNHEFIEKLPTNFHLTTQKDIQKIIRPRAKFSHKGTYGHALIIAGSEGKMGAAILAISACFRSGVGLATAYIPQCGINILQTAVPEAMAIENIGKDCLHGNYFLENNFTIGIGPGIGTNPETVAFVESVLKKVTSPLVIDADALNIIAKNKQILSFVPENSILTPHPQEFTRLVGEFTNDTDKLEKLKAFSIENRCYVVLKGANSAVACPNGKIYFNTTGNSGMATGGSGDVLTGIIVGLLAQGYSSKSASVLGVYLHGLSGDITAQKIGQEALIASDLIKNLGQAWIEGTQETAAFKDKKF